MERRNEYMTRVVCSVDKWVRCVKCGCYRYNPEDWMVPIVALEQIIMVERRGCVRLFSWRATLGLVLITP